LRKGREGEDEREDTGFHGFGFVRLCFGDSSGNVSNP